MPVVVHGRGPDDQEPGFPARADLVDVLERVHEEIRMARLLARQLALPDALSPHMVTALREALLVRIFRLRHFYYGRGEAEWEVVTSDFFSDPRDWAAARPPAAAHLSRWLDDLAEWIGPRIRVSPAGLVPPEAWPLDSLVQALVSTHRAFCEAVVEEHGEELPAGSWRTATGDAIVSGPHSGATSIASEDEDGDPGAHANSR